jgi:tight adherence protein B
VFEEKIMSETSIIILGVGGLLAVVIIIIGYFISRRDNDLMESRIAELTNDMGQEKISAFVEEESRQQREQVSAIDEARRGLLNPINNALQEQKFGKTWRVKLARANLKLTVAEFAVAHVVTTVIGFAAMYIFISPGEIMNAVFAAIIGFFVPRIYVGRLISQRLIAFETQLPDTLGLWVNALRSGYSVLQAMEAIARDAPEPTMTEFARVVKEVQIGIDVPDALDHLLERVESPDLDLVITAVNIQREVGGNLAEILEVISGTIRERIKLKGEIRVLTSQGRITGYLISGLPILLALFLNVASPGYMGLMFENRQCGWPMLGVGLSLIALGSAVIQKIVDIEI